MIAIFVVLFFYINLDTLFLKILEFAKLGETIIFMIFIVINCLICIADIRYRRIPNFLLFALIFLLPFWFYTGNSMTWDKLVLITIIDLILFSYGIFSFEKVASIGGGDIKYFGIILFFLGDSRISLFVWNVGELTLYILIFWLSYILGRISSRGNRDKKSILNKENFGFIIETFKGWRLLLFDWFVFGFALSIGIPRVLSNVIPLFGKNIGADYYFSLMLLIFILRPKLHALYHTKYSIFFLFAIIVYLIQYTMDMTPRVFLIEFVNFSKYIVGVGGMILLIDSISKFIFSQYQMITKSDGGIQNTTFPYSLIIFIGFLITII